MARRNEHSREELQAMALSAAEWLLDKKGTAALSARKVAAEIGYSAGSLYLVFKNLDDLCWQINARTLSTLLDELDRVECDDAEACLQRYGQTYLAFAERLANRWSLLFEHRSADGAQVPGWLSEKIDTLFRCLEAPLTRLFPDASASDLSLMARTLWGGVHGITVLNQRDKLFLASEAGADLMLEQLITGYLAGVRVSREQNR